MITLLGGTNMWEKSGIISIKFANGSEEWYFNGELHREKEPAKIYLNGMKFWYRHGYLHRLDGPAITGRSIFSFYSDWYIYGINYNEFDHLKIITVWKNYIENITKKVKYRYKLLLEQYFIEDIVTILLIYCF
jgi:hypothetical protein